MPKKNKYEYIMENRISKNRMKYTDKIIRERSNCEMCSKYLTAVIEQILWKKNDDLKCNEGDMMETSKIAIYERLENDLAMLKHLLDKLSL